MVLRDVKSFVKLCHRQMSRRAVALLEFGMAVMAVLVAGLGAASTSGPELSASLARIAGIF